MTEVSRPPRADDLERLLLGAERKYSREDVAELVGIDLSEARVFWRALGFPDTGGAVAFTDGDVDALRKVLGLLDAGLIDHDTGVQLVRGLGRMIGRLAEWQVDTLATIIDKAGGFAATTSRDSGGAEQTAGGAPDATTGSFVAHSDAAGADVADEGDASGVTGEAVAAETEGDPRLIVGYRLAEELLPVFESLLVYAWRRKLGAAAGRLVDVPDDESLLSVPMTVGFADLVSFTRLSRGLTASALAELVEAFEAVSNDVIAAGGGRVIKTIGDEVQFVTPSAEGAAAISCRLVDDIGKNPTLPNIRIGLATGRVVSRLGDVFGDPPNLASRMTSLAGRNVILTDEVTAKQLAGHAHFITQPLEPTEVRGFGIIQPYELRRRDAGRIPKPRDRDIGSPS